MDPAARTALQADLAIIVAGYTIKDEGEFVQGMLFFPAKGGDRDSLALKPHDESLIQAIAAANPNTIVVMIDGSAIITEA